MDTKALLKKVRKIEIKTRRLSDHVFGGEYHSTFKGRGMTFSEVRQYQYGDDVRSIDWNVTARYNEPYIKVFEEERELTLMLLVDVSGSEAFGTQKQFKREILTEIAESTDLSRKDVGAVIDELSSLIERHIKKRACGEFVLPGMLKITTVKKPKRPARKNVPNPFNPGTFMDVAAKPASISVKVRPLKKLKEMAI